MTQEFKDHIVQYPNRFKRVPVAGKTDEFDMIPTWMENPSEVVQVGTPIDRQLFEGFTSQLAERAINVSIGKFPRLALETTDRQRFQRALDYLSANGRGVLRVDIGADYIFNDTVAVPSDVTILGESKGLCVLDGTSIPASTDLFVADHKDNIFIQNLTVKAKRGSALRFNACSNVLVENCNILMDYETDANTAAVVFSRASDTRTENLSTIKVKNCYIKAAHLGVLVQGASNKWYENIDIKDNIVDLGDTSNFLSIGGEGIKIDYYCRAYNVENNKVYNGKRSCITVEEMCEDGQVVDNILFGSTFTVLSSCLRLYGGQTDSPVSRIKIKGNTMVGGTYGIFSEKINMLYDAIVTDNLIKGQAHTGIWGYFNDSKISDNKIYDCVEESIYNRDSIGTVIANNKCRNSKGITVDLCADFEIESNKVKGGIIKVYRSGDGIIDSNKLVNPVSSVGTAGAIFVYTSGASNAKSDIVINRNIVKGTITLPYGIAIYHDISNVIIRGNDAKGNTQAIYMPNGLIGIKNYDLAVTGISSAPTFVGQKAIVGTALYEAIGTSSTADWKRIDN